MWVREGFLEEVTAERRLKEYVRVGEENKKAFLKFILAVPLKLYQKSLKLEVGRLITR